MRVFGHPLHPMLVHFPIAFWTLGSACDALTLLGVPAAWPIACFSRAAIERRASYFTFSLPRGKIAPP